MSKGIPVHPPFVGAKAANLNFEQTSAKPPGVLPLDKIILNCLFVNNILTQNIRDFGGPEVACWPLVPKFAGSHPAEAVGYLGRKKNPQHAFLRRGSKAVGPMS
jgi:hypothetical protein